MGKASDCLFYIVFTILLVITAYLLFDSGCIDFFYKTDPKIDTLLEKVRPIFESDDYYTGNLKPLNNRRILNEVKVFKGDKSFTINKKRVFLCLKDENQQYYNDNMLIYVFLHELAHVICDEIGHTQKFHDIFEDVLDLAVEKGIWNPNIPIVQNYCEH